MSRPRLPQLGLKLPDTVRVEEANRMFCLHGREGRSIVMDLGKPLLTTSGHYQSHRQASVRPLVTSACFAIEAQQLDSAQERKNCVPY